MKSAEKYSLIKKITVLAILNIGFIFGKSDNLKALQEIFTVERVIEVNEEVLYADIANKTGDYVLLIDEKNNQNKVKYYTSNGDVKWEKRFKNHEAKFIEISDNGNTIKVSGSSIFLIDENGENLYSKDYKSQGYYLSPNGEFYFSHKAFKTTYFKYYTRKGELIKVNVPDKYNAPFYHLTFTNNNNILAVYSGKYSKTNSFKLKKIKKSQKKTVEHRSVIMLYNPESRTMLWSRKLTNNIFNPILFDEIPYPLSSEQYFLLYNDTSNEEGGFYCFNKDGILLWKKANSELISEEKLYIQSIVLSSAENEAFIYDGRGFIMSINLLNGKMINKYDVPNYNDKNHFMKLKILFNFLVLSTKGPTLTDKYSFIIDTNLGDKNKSGFYIDGGFYIGENNKNIFVDKNNSILMIGEPN